jgi:arginine decarboxylase
MTIPIIIPEKAFLTKGKGIHIDYLTSFEMALRNAGIEKKNLSMVSSILPPDCKIVSRDKGEKLMNPGQITFCVMSRNQTNEPYRLIASAVGLARPGDTKQHGYISEHHAYGMNRKECGDYAEDLAASMLATSLGIEFNPENAWEEREQIYKAEKQIIKTSNICQSATGNKRGLWTTVLAAVVLL